MSRTARRIPLGVIFLLAVLGFAGGADAQPQSREQQRCITALNAGFAKVAKARSRALVRCTKAAQKGDDFGACLGEGQAKLDKALAKLEKAESKKCSAAPDFGPQDLVTLGDAGAELATSAATDLFGAAPEAVLADKKAAKDTARCQLRVAKAAQKCALARVQAFNRCKKAGLKRGAIASAEDLAACLEDEVADPGGRLAKKCSAKLAKAAARCGGVDTATAFPACAAADAAGLASCADGRLACRARDALATADGMDVPGCGAITPELETERAVTATLGPDGGEVMAVGGDGTVYRLSVPSGALLSETAITITPVSAIPDLPLTGGLVAALQLAPDGLQLWQPATLTIELGAPPDPADLAGFGWSGPGEDVHLSLIALAGSTLTLGVTHFSGAGAAIVAPEDFAALQALPPGSVEQQYLNQMPAPDEVDPLVWVAWLSAWFDQGVAPLLEAATDFDEALLAGLDAFLAWKYPAENGAPSFLGVDPNFFLGLDGFALADRVDAGLALAAAGLLEGVVRNDEDCRFEEDLAYAESQLRWLAIAAALGLATEANGLDPATALEDFCAEAVYDVLTYPESPQVGVPGTLAVKLGYAIDGGEPLFDEDFVVDVLPEGTVEEFIVTFEAPAGEGDAEFTPDGTSELALQLDACLFEPDAYPLLSDGKLCQQALVVRGFTVTPETAQLEPGEAEDFAALLYGAPHPSVTWTATGGEITPAGVYTAGDVAGDFTVTATSNLSGVAETATVTIGEGGGAGAFEVVGFFAVAAGGASGCNFAEFVLEVENLGPEALPNASASASGASGPGSGMGSIDVTLTEDEATGVVTIAAAATGLAVDGECPPGSERENSPGQGNGSFTLDFDLAPGDGDYAFDFSGSLSGSGDFDVDIGLGPVGFGRVVSCAISNLGPPAGFSCPDGSTVSASGALEAGSWRLTAGLPALAGVVPVSQTAFDFVLTISPPE